MYINNSHKVFEERIEIKMVLALIVGAAVVIFLLCWILFRIPSADVTETHRTILSSDLFTKIMLTIIAISTSIVALQSFMSTGSP